jgi:hypothetical protein
MIPESREPETFVDATDNADRAIARKNMQWGWALFGLFWLLFAGTVAVALAYLWLD